MEPLEHSLLNLFPINSIRVLTTFIYFILATRNKKDKTTKRKIIHMSHRAITDKFEREKS